MIFVKQINISDDIPKDDYPFNIAVLKNLKSIILEKPVTFFVGENGSGKSTLIEAIAIKSGMNAEGGSHNMQFRTKDSHSSLYEYLTIIRGADKPITKYFLRAESFYNVASEIEELAREGGDDIFKVYGGLSLHNCSHGESFMSLIENRFFDKGLYILDEPEAALSPLRQMRLLVLINKLVKNGSQFIIATHSPILLSYPNADILNFDNNLNKIKYQDSETYKLYKLFIENPELMIKNLFEEE